MTSGRGADAATMSLRSAIPGRERWHVAALTGKTAEAADVAARLSAAAEIRQAKASGVTGSVIVEFDPSLPPLRVRSLIASAVTAALETERPHALDRRAVPIDSAAERLLRLARPHRATLIAASLLTIVERFAAAIAPLLAMWAVNILANGAAATLASVGLGTTGVQVAVIAGCAAGAAATAFVAKEAAQTLWGRLAALVETDLRQRATTEQIEIVGEFFRDDMPALIGYGVHTTTVSTASIAVFRRNALLILLPATIFGLFSILRPRPLLDGDADSRVPPGVREWFRAPHFATLAAMAAAAGTAWRAGWISLDAALLMLFFGELRIAPAMTIGHHIRETRAALREAVLLEAGTTAETPA